MTFAIATGIGFSAVGTMMLLWKLVDNPSFKFMSRDILRRKLKISSTKKALDKRGLLLGTILGLLSLGLATSLTSAVKLFIITFMVGVASLQFFDKFRKEVNRNLRLKEIATLFDAIELYVNANYTLFQAMQAAKLLVPGIAPKIQRCLDRWPASPRLALEQFSKDLATPEGEMLVSLLIYMESAGLKNLKGVLGREANNIERLRKMRAEAQISRKPIFLMMYRFLPVIPVIGIIAGTLMYRLYQVLMNSGLINIGQLF